MQGRWATGEEVGGRRTEVGDRRSGIESWATPATTQYSVLSTQYQVLRSNGVARLLTDLAHRATTGRGYLTSALRLFKRQILFADLGGDRTQRKVSHADAGDVSQQVISPPAIPAEIRFHPQDEVGKCLGAGPLHRAAGGD